MDLRRRGNYFNYGHKKPQWRLNNSGFHILIIASFQYLSLHVLQLLKCLFLFCLTPFSPFKSAVESKKKNQKIRAVENESAVSSCGVTAGVYLYAFILSRKVGTSEA